MSQQLGPNVVFVNTSGSSGVPLQVQQIIQQAQQQVLTYYSYTVGWNDDLGLQNELAKLTIES